MFVSPRRCRPMRSSRSRNMRWAHGFFTKFPSVVITPFPRSSGQHERALVDDRDEPRFAEPHRRVGMPLSVCAGDDHLCLAPDELDHARASARRASARRRSAARARAFRTAPAAEAHRPTPGVGKHRGPYHPSARRTRYPTVRGRLRMPLSPSLGERYSAKPEPSREGGYMEFRGLRRVFGRRPPDDTAKIRSEIGR